MLSSGISKFFYYFLYAIFCLSTSKQKAIALRYFTALFTTILSVEKHGTYSLRWRGWDGQILLEVLNYK